MTTTSLPAGSSARQQPSQTGESGAKFWIARTQTTAPNVSASTTSCEPPRVADAVVDRQRGGVVAPSRRLDQRGRGVDARDSDPLLGQGAAEHSLSARHVEHPFTRLRFEQAESTRDDDLPLILAATLADEGVVPARDTLPTERAVRGPGTAALRLASHRPAGALLLVDRLAHGAASPRPDSIQRSNPMVWKARSSRARGLGRRKAALGALPNQNPPLRGRGPLGRLRTSSFACFGRHRYVTGNDQWLR